MRIKIIYSELCINIKYEVFREKLYCRLDNEYSTLNYEHRERCMYRVCLLI